MKLLFDKPSYFIRKHGLTDSQMQRDYPWAIFSQRGIEYYYETYQSARAGLRWIDNGPINLTTGTWNIR